MGWFRKQQPAPVPPRPAPRELSPAEKVSEALREYEQYCYRAGLSAPDPAVTGAKEKIARAEKIIGEGRLGYAICALLEHVKYWPSWSERDDFQKYVGFAGTNIGGRVEDVPESRGHKKTVVSFTYAGHPYTLTFIDEGMSPVPDDVYWTGKIELSAYDEVLLGVDVISDDPDAFVQWRYSGVYAFFPGEWMKHLIEMSASISASNERNDQNFYDSLAIERAKRIKI